MTEFVTEVPQFPYSERSSANAPELVRQLLAPPEIVLNAEDMAAARVFDEGLFNGALNDTTRAESGRTLLDVYKLSVVASEQSFYLDYFETSEAADDLHRLGLTQDVERESVAAVLYDTEFIRGAVSPKERKEIAKRSEDWDKALLAEKLKNDPAQDWWEPAEPLICNYNPDKLLDKLQDLQAYRRFYTQVRKQLRDEPDGDLRIAKGVMLDCYTARINSLVADLYPKAVNLARQLDESVQSEPNIALAARLAAVVPIISSAVAADDFARRIDMVRNGVAKQDGTLTPISGDVLALAARSAEAVHGELAEPELSPDVIALMDNTIWTADQMKQFNELILADGGRLSEHQTTWQEAEERSGPAPDGKWQVVINPRRDSLAVSGDKRVMWVPEGFARTLSQLAPSGAVPVSAHEQTHVEQTEYDDVMAEQISLARIKGRRYVTMREMGGGYQEDEFQRQLGRPPGSSLYYLRALQAKEAGGTFLQAARASYDSYTAGRELDEASEANARTNAVDRTRRFYRHGGENSQPLDYVEQELILDALAPLSEEQRKAIVVGGGSFCLADAAALHRVGLFNLPTETNADPIATAMKVFNQYFLPALQAA